MEYKNFCITGGAGFIGSHFARKLIAEKNSGNEIGAIVVYDSLTYAADLNRLSGLEYTLVIGDICDTKSFSEMLLKFRITHIVNFAAESHVDRSLVDETPFLKTNILGTSNLLESASKYWLSTSNKFNGKMLLHISTDEVYGSIELNEKPANESTVLRPSNPYAATKAAADQLVIGKIAGEGFPASILRSSNNFGLGQHPEKLIPKVLECLNQAKSIPIYGNGEQQRCWLSVEVYCQILWNLIYHNQIGEIYNVRGDEIFSNIQLVQKIRLKFANKLNKRLDEVSPIIFIEDRKCHDIFYHIDDTKIKKWLLEKETEKSKIRIDDYSMDVFLNNWIESEIMGM